MDAGCVVINLPISEMWPAFNQIYLTCNLSFVFLSGIVSAFQVSYFSFSIEDILELNRDIELQIKKMSYETNYVRLLFML